MKRDKTTTLTYGEEQVMQLLWEMGEASVNELLDAIKEEPKPKYTTLATFLKILEEKHFIGRRPIRRGYTYFSLIEKETYARRVMSSMLDGYFNGSLVQLVSFFSNDEGISASEMDEIAEIIREAKAQKQ